MIVVIKTHPHYYPDRLKFKEEGNWQWLPFGTELAHLGSLQLPCPCHCALANRSSWKGDARELIRTRVQMRVQGEQTSKKVVAEA